MNVATQRVSTVPFVETGTIVHDGRAFTSLGAVDDGERLFAYHITVTSNGVPADVVTNWDGIVTFGKVISRRHYRGGFRDRTGRPARMLALRVRRPDGSLWAGRYGVDGGSFVRLRRVKGGK